MLVFGWWALLVLVLLAAGLVGLTAFRYGLLPTLFGGAPYMPTNRELVQVMLELATIKPTDHVVDLGSGDGRLIIAAGRKGAKKAVGYEIDLWRVWMSRLWARRVHLTNVSFEHQSFWKSPLQGVDVVFVYGLPPYMERLAQKCKAELPRGARVISLIYALPGWIPVETREDVHLYINV